MLVGNKREGQKQVVGRDRVERVVLVAMVEMTS